MYRENMRNIVYDKNISIKVENFSFLKSFIFVFSKKNWGYCLEKIPSDSYFMLLKQTNKQKR